jgi:hypothetical protein
MPRFALAKQNTFSPRIMDAQLFANVENTLEFRCKVIGNFDLERGGTVTYDYGVYYYYNISERFHFQNRF